MPYLCLLFKTSILLLTHHNNALFPANMLMFLANLSIYLVYPGNTTKDHVFQANLDKDYYVSR